MLDVGLHTLTILENNEKYTSKEQKYRKLRWVCHYVKVFSLKTLTYK